MSETVQANDGAMLPLANLPSTFTYSGGFIASISVRYTNQQGILGTYTQTFLNDGVNIIYISGWNNPAYPVHGVPMVTESGSLMVTEGGDLMVTE